MEESGPVQKMTVPDLADPEIYGSYGSGSETLVTTEIIVSATFSDPGTISSIKMIVHRELKQECVTFYAF